MAREWRDGSVMQMYGKEIFSTTFTVIELDLQFSIFVLKSVKYKFLVLSN